MIVQSAVYFYKITLYRAITKRFSVKIILSFFCITREGSKNLISLATG